MHLLACEESVMDFDEITMEQKLIQNIYAMESRRDFRSLRRRPRNRNKYLPALSLASNFKSMVYIVCLLVVFFMFTPGFRLYLRLWNRGFTSLRPYDSKKCLMILGNNGLAYAWTPVKWGSENDTFWPRRSRHWRIVTTALGWDYMYYFLYVSSIL